MLLVDAIRSARFALRMSDEGHHEAASYHLCLAYRQLGFEFGCNPELSNRARERCARVLEHIRQRIAARSTRATWPSAERMEGRA